MSSEKLKMPFQTETFAHKGHYKNNCIAPKLVDRTEGPSVESDVYSLNYLINTVSGLSKLKTLTCFKKGLSELALIGLGLRSWR